MHSILGGNRCCGSIKQERGTGSAVFATSMKLFQGVGFSALSLNHYLTLGKSLNLIDPLLICKMEIICFEDKQMIMQSGCHKSKGSTYLFSCIQ